MKKNIYFFQVNNSLSGSLYLPYSVGTIAAYSFSKSEIKDNFDLKKFFIVKTDYENIRKNMEKPYIVAFSNYMWNIGYNLKIAEKIKKDFPECIVIFGGHQIPDNTMFLERYPFIDILIHGEGEAVFYDILKQLSKQSSISEVPNISYRCGEKTIQSIKQSPKELTDFPSPYAMGLFDDILTDEEFADIQFDAVVETNRGCPYGCIYCSWARSGADFRQFTLERVKRDLEWVAEHKIAYCFCADSNFGILERDEEIADYVISLKKEYGYPERFETTSAKDKDDLIFQINQKLNSENLVRSVALAVQSMTPEVLKIAGRYNMSAERFSQQLEHYRNAGMHTYTDIILGLPGESFESFCRSLFDVIEAGQHHSLTVYRCEMLPNTILSSTEFIEKYQIETVKSNMFQIHSNVEEDNLDSFSEIIVKTNTLSRQDWSEALKIAAMTQALHCLGLLKYIAVYLRKAKNISYYDFYMNLFKQIDLNSEFIKRNTEYVFSCIPDFLSGKCALSFYDNRFGNMYLDFEEALFLCFIYNIDSFFNEIKGCIESYFEDKSLMNDLIDYQKQSIALPCVDEKEVEFQYNWCEYFKSLYDRNVYLPKKVNSRYKMTSTKAESWEEYAKVNIWYGKRSLRTLNKVFACRDEYQ